MRLRRSLSLTMLLAFTLVHAGRAGATPPIVEPVDAKQTHVEPGRGLRAFLEVGQATFGDAVERQVGFRILSLTPNDPCIDFALGVWLASGAVITPDVDLALPIALDRSSRLVPHAGATGLLAGGGGFLFLTGGVNAGVGLILGANGPITFHADYTARKFNNVELRDDGLMHVVTLGITWGAGESSRTHSVR